MELPAIIDVLAQGGGWGAAALTAWLYVDERKAVRKLHADIFALLQRQLKLLGDSTEDR